MLTFGLLLPSTAAGGVELRPVDAPSGFIARLLINEAAFPGERGWMSEADSKAAMLSIMWVLHCRLHHIPPGYRQEHIAAVRTEDVIEIITVGGEKGQCDGFYLDSDDRPRAVGRVHERIDYLMGIANKGEPGRFARLLAYAQDVANAYVESGITGVDRFADLQQIDSVAVTGRAYSWMTDRDYYRPGGNFVRIPDEYEGALGGNRFFTLRKLQ